MVRGPPRFGVWMKLAAFRYSCICCFFEFCLKDMDEQSGMQFTATESSPAFDAFQARAVPITSVALGHSSRLQARSPFQSATKRMLDVAGALTLAIVFSLAMRRDGGDVLFRHTRIGRNGKAFQVYKFRTMVPNADKVLAAILAADAELREEWLRDHKLKNDPRVTRIGRFLRSTSLDELPQLWNVLKGEMSLVGPRPVTKEELVRYGRATRHYLAVKPGLTGLWQVSGRNDTNYCRRVAMDRYYASSTSLVLDFVLLTKTVVVVVGRRGAY